MNILGLVPARGGSKGVYKKNIAPVFGKPLMQWTIEASIKSLHITDTIVSSDDEEILNIAESLGAQTIKRPKEYSTDEATSSSVVIHALKECAEQGVYFDYVVLLQPTSPLRGAREINEALDLIFNSNVSAVISVTKSDNKFLKSFKMNKDGYIEGVVDNLYPFTRRQDLPQTYISNGAIYIVKVKDFLESESFFTSKTLAYEMSEDISLDIDSEADLKHAEKFFQNESEH